MREYRVWTKDEEQALRMGVAKHGSGSWELIRTDPEFNTMLQGRSGIQLKDKWRNLVKFNHLSPEEINSGPKGRVAHRFSQRQIVTRPHAAPYGTTSGPTRPVVSEAVAGENTMTRPSLNLKNGPPHTPSHSTPAPTAAPAAPARRSLAAVVPNRMEPLTADRKISREQALLDHVLQLTNGVTNKPDVQNDYPRSAGPGGATLGKKSTSSPATRSRASFDAEVAADAVAANILSDAALILPVSENERGGSGPARKRSRKPSSSRCPHSRDVPQRKGQSDLKTEPAEAPRVLHQAPNQVTTGGSPPSDSPPAIEKVRNGMCHKQLVQTSPITRPLAGAARLELSPNTSPVATPCTVGAAKPPATASPAAAATPVPTSAPQAVHTHTPTTVPAPNATDPDSEATKSGGSPEACTNSTTDRLMANVSPLARMNGTARVIPASVQKAMHAPARATAHDQNKPKETHAAVLYSTDPKPEPGAPRGHHVADDTMATSQPQDNSPAGPTDHSDRGLGSDSCQHMHVSPKFASATATGANTTLLPPEHRGMHEEYDEQAVAEQLLQLHGQAPVTKQMGSNHNSKAVPKEVVVATAVGIAAKIESCADLQQCALNAGQGTGDDDQKGGSGHIGGGAEDGALRDLAAPAGHETFGEDKQAAGERAGAGEGEGDGVEGGGGTGHHAAASCAAAAVASQREAVADETCMEASCIETPLHSPIPAHVLEKVQGIMARHKYSVLRVLPGGQGQLLSELAKGKQFVYFSPSEVQQMIVVEKTRSDSE